MPRNGVGKPQVASEGPVPLSSIPLETVPLSRLRPHPRNYREHPEDQLAHIIRSIEEHGVYRNVVVAEDYTVAFNAFVQHKVQTMRLKGGNTGIYQGDGRLKMARSLERLWPGVARVERKFKRPQHVIAKQWAGFTTPLKLKPDLPPADPAEFRMDLKQIRPVKAESLKQWLAEIGA